MLRSGRPVFDRTVNVPLSPSTRTTGMSDPRRATAVPARVRWAVESLGVRPDDQILEIGCGNGVAMSLICDRLVRGRITAIDRSASAIARASLRNAAHIAAGKALLRKVDLSALSLPGTRFDVVFAINVNLFWVPSAATELTIIRNHLRPGGVCRLFYETPTDDGRANQIAQRVAASLRAHGFSPVTVDAASPRLVGITGHAP